jgi:hypothetical protein
MNHLTEYSSFQGSAETSRPGKPYFEAINPEKTLTLCEVARYVFIFLYEFAHRDVYSTQLNDGGIVLMFL